MNYLVVGNETLLGRRFEARLREAGQNVVSCRSDDVSFDGGGFDYAIHSGPTMGIVGNERYPADLMTNNLQSTISFAKRLPDTCVGLYLASSCCYPVSNDAPGEELFGQGPLEPVSSYYATSKIASVKLLQAFNKQFGRRFVCAVPTNVFGPQDDIGPNGHVVTGIMSKIHAAKTNSDEQVVLMGSGSPIRELMYADDAVDACLFAMSFYKEQDVINIASGSAITIKDLAGTIAEVVGFKGRIVWDTTRPDGALYKALRCDKLLSLGWVKYLTPLRVALEKTYVWFKENNR